jgi:O-antigen/teichoic acid export membrane protein
MVLSAAMAISRFGGNVLEIMMATLLISSFALVAQGLALRSKFGSFSPLPSWRYKTVSNIASFGIFSWLQALAGVAFGQADRLFVGFIMGAPALAYYGLCVQAAQPIHGLIASAMHFLFPHLSARYPIESIVKIRRKIVLAVKANMILVCVLSLPLVVFGNHIIAAWFGKSFGQQPAMLYPTIASSFALLGMNVTAHYALLAVGQMRTIAYLNICAGVAMLLIMVVVLPKGGLQGAALARMVYGPITCLAYVRLRKIIWQPKIPALRSQAEIFVSVIAPGD